ncbi:hypothetical protein HZB06_02095 [Candidatus Wolfebacteria bacterium]|nr:hypothetical protein [Candidatus Wolfebacteria bacterium]
MEKKDNNKGGGYGFFAVIIVWSGLLWMILTYLPAGGGGGNFLASAVDNFNGRTESRSGIIVFSEDGKDFKSAVLHFSRGVDIYDIERSADKRLMFAASDRGLFISRDNGLNWHNFSDIEEKITPNAIVYGIHPKGFISVFRAGKGFLYKSEDNFYSLKTVLELDNEAVYGFDVSGDRIYLGLSDGKLMVYSLKKNTFRLLKTFSGPVKSVKVAGNGLIYLTLKNGGLWASADGENFSRREFLSGYRGAEQINSFSFGYENDFSIYAATAYGLIRSLNSGLNWQNFKTLPSEQKEVSAVGLSFSEIYAASGGKIYKSADNGLSWRIIDPEVGGRQISLIKIYDGKIIVGTKD